MRAEYEKMYGVANDLYFDKSEFIFCTSEIASGNGDGSDSYVYLGIIAYKKWRVVGMGFHVYLNHGASEIAESIEFGNAKAGVDSVDNDAFGKVTQDIRNGKQWISGDMVFYGDSHMVTPAAQEYGGVSEWRVNETYVGRLFNVWRTRPAMIRLTKVNVTGSSATVRGLMLIEAKKS